jgi:hypothetical protein
MKRCILSLAFLTVIFGSIFYFYKKNSNSSPIVQENSSLSPKKNSDISNIKIIKKSLLTQPQKNENSFAKKQNFLNFNLK